ATRDVRLTFKEDSLRVSVGQLPDDHPLFAALDAVQVELDALTAALAGQAERAETIGACVRGAREVPERLRGWGSAARPETPEPASRDAEGKGVQGLQAAQAAQADAEPNEKVRWIEVFSHTVQLHETPLSVAPIFAKQRAGVPRAWVFTSATLSVRGDFTHYA